MYFCGWAISKNFEDINFCRQWNLQNFARINFDRQSQLTILKRKNKKTGKCIKKYFLVPIYKTFLPKIWSLDINWENLAKSFNFADMNFHRWPIHKKCCRRYKLIISTAFFCSKSMRCLCFRFWPHAVQTYERREWKIAKQVNLMVALFR